MNLDAVGWLVGMATLCGAGLVLSLSVIFGSGLKTSHEFARRQSKQWVEFWQKWEDN